jgi:hypothetical protein
MDFHHSRRMQLYRVLLTFNLFITRTFSTRSTDTDTDSSLLLVACTHPARVCTLGYTPTTTFYSTCTRSTDTDTDTTVDSSQHAHTQLNCSFACPLKIEESKRVQRYSTILLE